MRYLFISLIALFMISCGSSTIKKSETKYDNETNTVLYKGKPFTGTVIGEGEESNRSAKIKDGKVISETRTYQNGYKEIKNSDGTEEYYNYDGKRISKEDFVKNK